MSIHPDLLALIHADIDGVATDAELLRLREAISSNTEVRDEYRRLHGLCDLIARVEPEEPPAGLAPGVMRAIRAGRGTAKDSLADRLRSVWPGGRMALRYGYAVAAGALLGMLGLHFATGGSLFGSAVRERDAVAAIAPPAGPNRLDLAAVGISGFATLRPSAAGAAIGLELRAVEPVEFVLRYDPAKDGGRVDVLVVRGGETTEAGSLRFPR